ncbi:hypothetical protein OH491_04540 [Termitidicoccus mucosus]|uniref:Uncharacterized protein n=1 Tax=Termitidicoccus mucosus TaxID=1184151 RepID=A0A178INU5_9BACT|nr:hypothetical protein AW736_05060 [Opitutaceae bacterium TSB47]
MKTTRWEYSTGRIEGFFESDGLHLKNESRDTKDGALIGQLLLPYRLLSRDGWHGEGRETPHAMAVLDNGIECRWPASLAHPADLTIRTTLGGEGVFDVSIRIEARHGFRDYELFYSNYFDRISRSLHGGAYVASLPAEKPVVPGWTQVFPGANPIFREMYIAFPRDEHGAALICDGRWQRGRHFTRFAPCRYYAEPIGFYHNPGTGLAVSMMASREDCYSVSMAYRADDPHDKVGQHCSLYLSLFGRDIQPGETANARLRMVADDSGADATRHFAHFEEFSNSIETNAS